MELKNAVAVCLISFFSATLVLLIARTLDQRAAARLEPHLARMVEELEAIRQQGGIPTNPSGAVDSQAAKDSLVAYYFHGNTRCETCRAIESQSHEAIKTHFAKELQDGTIVWKTLNYEQPSGDELAKKFDVQVPVVVLARRKDGNTVGWERLDKVWALVDDHAAFTKFVRAEVTQMLVFGRGTATPAAVDEDILDIPLPNEDVPLPNAPLDIPIPD